MRKQLVLVIFSLALINRVYAQQVIDKIVAVVEDEIILQSELTQYTLNLAFQLRIDPRKDLEKFEELQQEMLNNLINQKILVARADEDSIEVDDRQVDTVLEEQINRMLQQVGSEQKLEEQLGMSIKKFKRTFRDEVKKNLKVEKLQQTRFGQVKITRREVEDFYNTMRDSLPELKETVDISHILLEVKPGEDSEQGARKRVENLLQRVKNGENFENLCRQYSEDPGSATRGGEIGFMQRGDFVTEFEEVAFLLEPGQYSEIVKTRFGFHIIECIERKGDKINVRHLLIRLEPTEGDEQDTGKRIKEIRTLLDDPQKDFGIIAKQYSDDETTKEQGGHLGLFELDNLQEQEFKAVIESLKPGEISQPFKTRFGWHIMKLNGRQEPRALLIDKDWEKIETWALNLKRQKEIKQWLEEIKKDVYVEVKMD